jgi:hypothetical protein
MRDGAVHKHIRNYLKQIEFVVCRVVQSQQIGQIELRLHEKRSEPKNRIDDNQVLSHCGHIQKRIKTSLIHIQIIYFSATKVEKNRIILLFHAVKHAFRQKKMKNILYCKKKVYLCG